MAFTLRDPSEAIRAVLRGEHVFSDTTRATAVEEVRNIAEDRIYSGRRPQNSKRPWIQVSIVGTNRKFNLHAESDCGETFIEITAWSKDRTRCYRLADAIRQALAGCNDTITTSLGSVEISCTLDGEGENDPDKAPDASKDYEFAYDLSFRVFHTELVAASQT